MRCESLMYAALFVWKDGGKVAAKKNPLADKALEMYRSGMKLVDIASRLNLPSGTVRRWKSTYHWDGERSGGKSERSEKKRANKKKIVDDGTRGTLQNADLSPEQQMFCIYYIRTFNATQSYRKAYGCSYEVANARGSVLLVQSSVRAEIERLKEIKRQQIIAETEDIVELQMRIAFADLGDYVDFGKKEVKLKNGKKVEVSYVDLQDASEVDTQLIRKIKEGRDGVSVELEDRQKAIAWLSKYFLMFPEDKYRAEFEQKRLEKDGALSDEQESDGFIDALKEDMAQTFSEDSGIVET